MKDRYLEVTFRRGRPIAAYLHLPRRPGDRSARTSPAAPGLVVDYAVGGRPIGVEIVTPRKITLAAVNRVLVRLKLPPLDPEELSPLVAA